MENQILIEKLTNQNRLLHHALEIYSNMTIESFDKDRGTTAKIMLSTVNMIDNEINKALQEYENLIKNEPDFETLNKIIEKINDKG